MNLSVILALFRLQAFILSLVVIAMSSCSTQPSVKPGLALVEIDLKGVHMSRIRNPEFVSVNGNIIPKGRRHLYLPPGAQDIEIRFALPETDELSANLRFTAGANKYYIVKFETFPHASGRLFTNYNNRGDGQGDIIGVPVWLAYNVVAQSVYEAKEREMAVMWTNIKVISADPSEGKVASAIVKGSLPNPQNNKP